jgi:hypothetical protein
MATTANFIYKKLEDQIIDFEYIQEPTIKTKSMKPDQSIKKSFKIISKDQTTNDSI